MKKFILIAAVAAALLGGCAEIRQIPGLDPSKPRVTVNLQNTGKPISVAPDPLVFLAGQTNVTIVWSLPKGSNLRFAENGIVIEGEITDRIVRSIQNDRAVDSIVIDRAQKEIVECRIANEGLDFTCLNRHTRPGLYKYTIRVLEGGKPLASLDPTVAMISSSVGEDLRAAKRKLLLTPIPASALDPPLPVQQIQQSRACPVL